MNGLAAFPNANASTPAGVAGGPVSESERIVTLDVLRGAAVLGILLVNIAFFAAPLLESQDFRWKRAAGLDAAMGLLVRVFCDFKFITLFSLLFGMGLALQSRRAAAAGRAFGGLYARRLLVLLAIGILHGVLLWYGDILGTYALLGFIALACRNVGTRRLLIAAGVLFTLPLLFLAGIAALAPEADWSETQSWGSYAEDERRARRGSTAHSHDGDSITTAPALSAETVAMSRSATKPAAASAPADRGEEIERRVIRLFQFLDREAEIYRKGPVRDIVLHRSIYYFIVVGLIFNAKVAAWRCLAMFFVGIVFMRWGVFDGTDRHAATFRCFLRWGLAIGLPLEIAAFILMNTSVPNAWIGWSGVTLHYTGSMALCLAYAGGLALLCMKSDWLHRLSPLAAVGRMALTNYLLHSVLCGLIFYSYGLGLFGAVGFAQCVGVALAIFGLQLVLSPHWLRHFQFGPVEWLWRCLTYGRLVPMRRRAVRLPE